MDTERTARTREVITPSYDEAAELIAACGRSSTGMRDRAALALMWGAGLRSFEVCGRAREVRRASGPRDFTREDPGRKGQPVRFIIETPKAERIAQSIATEHDGSVAGGALVVPAGAADDAMDDLRARKRTVMPAVRVLEEVRPLLPRHVRADGTVEVPSGKGNKGRKARIGPPVALEWVQDWKDERKRMGIESSAPLICTIKRGTGRRVDASHYRRLLARLGPRVGLEGMHPHALRHAFATDLYRRGVPLAEIQQLLGHSSLAITSAYIRRLTADEAGAAVERAYAGESDRAVAVSPGDAERIAAELDERNGWAAGTAAHLVLLSRLEDSAGAVA